MIGFLPTTVPGKHDQWRNNGIIGGGQQIGSKQAIHGIDGPGDSSGFQWGWDISTFGGNSSHNNMPPYLTVNIWKRVK